MRELRNTTEAQLLLEANSMQALLVRRTTSPFVCSSPSGNRGRCLNAFALGGSLALGGAHHARELIASLAKQQASFDDRECASRAARGDTQRGARNTRLINASKSAGNSCTTSAESISMSPAGACPGLSGQPARRIFARWLYTLWTRLSGSRRRRVG